MNTRQYFQDKTIFSLFVLSLITAGLGILAVVLRIHSSDVLVPIRFLPTSDVQRASWPNLYIFAAFYLITGVIHVLLSMRLFTVKRGYAYAALAAYLVLVILGWRVAGAVINLYY